MPDLIVQNPIAACCEPSPTICTTYTSPKICASLTNYAMSCGCCDVADAMVECNNTAMSGPAEQ